MKLVFDRASVSVPASVLNIGPTFESLAMAVGLSDSVTAKAVAGPSSLRQVSRGASVRPAILRLHGAESDSHPIVRAAQYVLEQVGSPRVGLEISYEAGVPRRVGLGSLEVQVAAGFVVAREMLGNPPELDWQVLAGFAESFQLSLPRVATSLIGGVNVLLPAPEGDLGSLLSVPAAQSLPVTVFVPDFTVDDRNTDLMPSAVPFKRNVRNAGRAAALVPLLTDDTLPHHRDLLFSATEDDVYQVYEEPLSPASMQMVRWLRNYGLPAVLSGAGPAVVCLASPPAQIISAARKAGWEPFEVSPVNAGPVKLSDLTTN